MAKKRCLIVFLLFIIPSVYALYEEVAVSGWVNSSNTLTTKDNRTFTIQLAPGNLRIIVNMPNSDSLTVKNGSCEVIGFYDVCFLDSAFAYHDYEEDRDYYKAKVSIYDIIANLEMTRTISAANLLINEEAIIGISIINSGDREATNVKFTDKFPPPFVITSVSGCLAYGDEIGWDGSLNKLQEKKCSYTIKSIAAVNYTSKANISYFNGKETKYEYSDSKFFNIPDHQLNVKADLSANNAEINEKVRLDVKIQNNHSRYPIRVENFYIDIPIGLKILNTPALFEREYNKFKWRKTLEPLEEKESSIELNVEEKKKYVINVHAEYIINNVRNSIDKFLILNEPSLEVKKTNTTLPSEKNITSGLNESAIINDSNDLTNLTNNTNISSTATENISTMLPEAEAKEEQESIIPEKEGKIETIKKINSNMKKFFRPRSGFSMEGKRNNFFISIV